MTKDEWMQQRRAESYPWMNDDQFECWCMFCDLMGGENHVFGKVKPASANGITVSEFAGGGLATFDSNHLTRAVVMAHDRCIRFSIKPSNMQNLRFYLHKRVRSAGESYARHPTLEDHIEAIRKQG